MKHPRFSLAVAGAGVVWGIVAISTGNPALSTRIAGEWPFWKASKSDSLHFVSRLPQALMIMGTGGAVFLLIGALLVWREQALKSTPNGRTGR